MAQDGTDLIPEPGADDHVRGSLDAAVVITEYGDFECPYCGESYRVIEDVLAKYGDRVAFVFRQFPLPMHAHALAAAEAAEAAGAAGKFWPMYDALYRNQKALTERDLRRYADEIGVGGGTVAAAISGRTYQSRIERDQKSGNQSGVEGTPSLFVNGFAVDDDDVSVEALSEIIDRALAARAGR
jgi:protein-disulfide isomerase